MAVKYRCDRCKTAFAPLEAWPTHPRQGWACCTYCGGIVTRYVQDASGEWVPEWETKPRRCPTCDGLMHHERLRGWTCQRGCPR